MHNGMTLTRIQGQGQRDPKVAKSTKLRQAVSHHKMLRKIGLLLHKVRFQAQNVLINIFGILFNQNKRKIKHIFADVCR